MLTQLVALIVRCYALWLGLQSVRAFGALLELESVNAESAAALLGLGAMELGVAIALWFFPFTIAKKLSPISENADFSGLTPGGLYSAGMVLLGVYWVSRALYASFYWAAYIALAGSDTHGVAVEESSPLSGVMAAAQLFLGASLIVGRHRIKAVILSLRQGGVGRDDF